MLFLAGVPGALKRLKDRLTPSGTTETLTDARMLKLDNLDATIASRAPSSTALSTATWTGTKAGYLDAAISSVKMKPQVNLVRDTAVNTRTLFTGASGPEGHGAVYTAGTITAPTYVELMSVAVPGWLYLVATYRESTFASGTLSTRITIDGDVWDVVTDSASTTQYAGHVALGVLNDAATVIIPLAMRFETSMKVEVVSSVNQTSGKVSARILYSLDT
jgi:hypothetical protein